MPLTDKPLEELLEYRPTVEEPAGFDTFWSGTLEQARGRGGEVRLTPVTDGLLGTLDVFDVRFPGWNGEPVAAWLIAPRGATGPLPTVVKYIGYRGGRGLPTDHLVFPAAGYAHLVVDTRGQGHDTPDHGEGPAPHWVGGMMTRGIDSPEHYYYRRLMTDCVRAVDAARTLDVVDPEKVIVSGGSQGGGLALAVAGLAPDLVAAALVDVPFLCHYRRAAQISGEGPYVELAEYLRWHSRHHVEGAFTTLGYFDGLHFASRATAPALFSVGLMDPICPPSTVFAAYHRYAGERSIRIWEFADHGGGYGSQPREQLLWLRERGLAPKISAV